MQLSTRSAFIPHAIPEGKLAFVRVAAQHDACRTQPIAKARQGEQTECERFRLRAGKHFFQRKARQQLFPNRRPRVLAFRADPRRAKDAWQAIATKPRTQLAAIYADELGVQRIRTQPQGATLVISHGRYESASDMTAVRHDQAPFGTSGEDGIVAAAAPADGEVRLWTGSGYLTLATASPAVDGRQAIVVTNAGYIMSFVAPASEPEWERITPDGQ